MGGSIESLPDSAVLLTEPEQDLGYAKPLWSRSSPGEGITLALDPLPVLSLGSERNLRFHLNLIPAIFGFAIFWLGGSMLWEFMGWAARPGNRLGMDIGLTAMPTDLFSSSANSFGLTLAVAMTISTLVFALGHGFGYGLTQRSMTDFGLSLTGWARPSTHPHNSYRAIVPPITSSLSQITLGVGGILMLGGLGWSALQVAFLLIASFGVLNLLLPISRRSAGATFWRHLGRIAIGRGARRLPAPTVQQISISYSALVDDPAPAKS